VIALVVGHVSGDGLIVQVVAVVPGLLGTNKVNNLDAISESKICLTKKDFNTLIEVKSRL
jgi:hypothetical protein